MPEFVARNIRNEKERPYEIEYSLDHEGMPKPLYAYERLARVNTNFPVFDYAGSGVVAFMNPDNMEIAMPTWERLPYGSREHVLFHETMHIYTEMDHGHHDERGFNDMAVDALRTKTGYNFFPFASY